MPWPFGKKEGQQTEDDKKEMDAFIEKIGLSVEQKIEAKLKPIGDEVIAMKTRWDNLEKAANGGDDGHKPDPEKNPDGSELSEEQKRERRDRALLVLNIGTNARITEGEVIGEAIAQGFSEFVPKLKETFAGTPIERKGQADYALYCRNCLKYIVGEAAMAGGLRFNPQSKRFFLEDAAGKSGQEGYDFLAGDMTWTDPKSGKTFSASEQLAKLGIKPDEFAESVKKGAV